MNELSVKRIQHIHRMKALTEISLRQQGAEPPFPFLLKGKAGAGAWPAL